MNDDPKFTQWLTLQQRIYALIIARRGAQTVAGRESFNVQIDNLSDEARPLWELLIVRYPVDDLSSASRAVWEAMQ